MAARNGPKWPLNHEPEAVTYAREKAGLTKTRLAKACGVSTSLISEIEKGTRNATTTNLEKIAKALNCPVVVLERKRDTPPAKPATPTGRGVAAASRGPTITARKTREEDTEYAGAILRMYLQGGLSINEIAQTLRLSNKRVRRILAAQTQILGSPNNNLRGRKRPKCGTMAAVDRHNYYDEELDEACRQVRNLRTRTYQHVNGVSKVRAATEKRLRNKYLPEYRKLRSQYARTIVAEDPNLSREQIKGRARNGAIRDLKSKYPEDYAAILAEEKAKFRNKTLDPRSEEVNRNAS